jgi:hypothetical protein
MSAIEDGKWTMHVVHGLCPVHLIDVYASLMMMVVVGREIPIRLEYAFQIAC